MSFKFQNYALPISKGGTGATSVSGVLSNLGVSNKIIVWDDAESWATVLPKLTAAGFIGTLIVVQNSDFSNKVITAGSYDFSKLQFVGNPGTVAQSYASIEFAEGVVLTNGTIDLTNIVITSSATATPHITTSAGIVFRLFGSQIFSSTTTPFAALSAGGQYYVYLYNSSLGTFGTVAFFDITGFVDVIYYLFDGSGLGPFMQDDASSQAQVTLDSGSHYYPWFEDPFNPNQSFTGISSVTVSVVDIANGLRYKDTAPFLGATNVQSAIDTIKNTYAPLFEVPLKVSFADYTGQTAAIAATTIYSVPPSGAGMYRISWVAKVTTAASVSSVLGGTSLGLQVIYTDQDDSVVTTTQANLSGSTNSGNTTTSTAGGSIIVSAAASTDIQFKIGYTSVGTAMAYNLHVKVESL